MLAGWFRDEENPNMKTKQIATPGRLKRFAAAYQSIQSRFSQVNRADS
jgi:hypothetical protein